MPFVKSRSFVVKSIFGLAAASLAWAVAADVQEWKSGVNWKEPALVTPGEGTAAPSDAIVLFDGKDLAAWEGVGGWKIEDGCAVPGGSDGHTKQHFADCQLHVEFATPEKVEGDGQGRGNSGVFLMGEYEVQVLDSFGNTTYFDGQCGSLYKQRPPLVNCSKKPGEWQEYDIIFHAPHFHPDGSLISPATITVLQNNILVQDNVELLGDTEYHRPPVYENKDAKAPIRLQFHGNPVKFRNIWLRELAAR